MLRAIILSLALLVAIFVGMQWFGPGAEHSENRLLLAALNNEEGEHYRRMNALRPGVAVLESGVQVEVLSLGDGPEPELDDWIEVHYQAWHIDGRQFDNSIRRGTSASLRLNQAIPAWRETLSQVPAGTSLRLVVPPEQGYGRGGSGSIGPDETLIFEVHLIAVLEPPTQHEPQAWEVPVPGLR